MPPVERISTPSAARPRANSTTPVLSCTLMSARLHSSHGVSLIADAAAVDLEPPFARRAGPPPGRSGAPRRGCASARVASVSSVCTGTAACSTMGPVSTPSSTKCTVAPDTRTPCSSAWRCGCRPGKAGRSEGWMLRSRPAEVRRRSPRSGAACSRRGTRGRRAAPRAPRSPPSRAPRARDAGPARARPPRSPSSRATVERARARAVRDEHDHRGGHAPARGGLGEGAEVGAAPGGEHADPQRLRHSPRPARRPRSRRSDTPRSPRASRRRVAGTASSGATTITKPMPMLKVRRISASSTAARALDGREDRRQRPRSADRSGRGAEPAARAAGSR